MNPNIALAWQDINDDFKFEADTIRVEGVLMGAIARQREKYGDDLRKPCPEAQELLDQLSEETGQDCLQWWRGMVARMTPGAKPSPVDGGEYRYDALVTGEDSDEWQALRKTPVTITTGYLYPNDPRKTTKDGKWNGVRLTVDQIIEGHPGNMKFGADRIRRSGLSRSSVGEKAGFGYVFLNCLGNRKAEGAASVCALWGDYDTGEFSFDEFNEKAQALGWSYIVWETHSNGTTQTLLKRDAVVKEAGCEGNPTLEEVKAYLQNKKHLAPRIVASAKIEDQHHPTKDGEMIVVSHDPIPKYRAIWFIAGGDVPLMGEDAIANTQSAARQILENKLRGMSELVGVPTDPATLDAARFLFAPRHPKGTKQRIVIHRGKPIPWDAIPEVEKPKAANAKGKAREDVVTECDFNVSENRRRYGMRQRFADMMEHTDAYLGSAGDDKTIIRCAFHEEHTDSSEDTATIAWNPDAHSYEFGSITCQHSCKDRYDPADYIKRYVDDGILPVEWLEDPQWMDPLPDDAKGEQFAQYTPEEIAEGIGEEDPHAWVSFPFKVKHSKIYKLAPEGSDKGDAELCQAFDVIGRSSNLTGDGDAGRIIGFINENGVYIEKTLDRADLFKSDGGGVIDDLARAGMKLYFSGRNGRGDFLDLLRSMKSSTRIPIVRQGGWTRDAAGRVTGFMMMTGKYIPAVKDAPQMRLHSTGRIKDPRPMGELEKWTEGSKAAQHNFFWVVGLCAGFVGPVMDLIGAAPCGFNFSGGSSKGKTIAGVCATSAAATTKSGHGTTHTMNNTPNAVEDLLATASGGTALLDEVGAMQRLQDLTSMLFGASSGSGKNRKAGRGAGLADAAEFCTFVLTTHERSLKTTITGAGVDYKTGVSVRFPDIDVTDNKEVDKDVIAQLDLMRTNYGHALPAFVSFMIAEKWHEREDALKARVSEAQDEIAGPAATPALRRAAGPFAIVQVAGLIASEAGLIEEGPIKTAIKKAFATFKASEEGRATDDGDALVDAFRSWFATNMGKGMISAEDAVSVGYGDVRGWYSAETIILAYDRIDPKAMGINATRSDLLAAFNKIGAVNKSGKNNYHNALPADVKADKSEAGERKVRNVRLSRSVLGI